MVADQADVGPLGDDLAAAVRRRPVADDVAEAPDRFRLPGVDLLEHREQCLLVSVNVGDDCNARHRAVGNGSDFVRRVARRRIPALADECSVRPRRRGPRRSPLLLGARRRTRRRLPAVPRRPLAAADRRDDRRALRPEPARPASRAHARPRTHRRRRDRGDADARHALVRLAAVRLRRAVVGGAARPRAARLPLVDLRAVGAALVRGALRARVRRHRAEPRRLARRPLVARRRARLRRVRRALRVPQRLAAPVRHARRPRARACARTFACSSGARASRARRCTSRTSATSRLRRTRTRAASGRRRT